MGYDRRDTVLDAVMFLVEDGPGAVEAAINIIAQSVGSDAGREAVRVAVETAMLVVARMTPEMLAAVKAWSGGLTCHKLDPGCHRGAHGMFCHACIAERAALGLGDKKQQQPHLLTDSEQRLIDRQKKIYRTILATG